VEPDEKNRDFANQTIIIQPGDRSVLPQAKQALLTVIRGGGADLGQNQSIEELLDIGRGTECGLRLTDMQVSSRHARISLRLDGCYVLEDLGSTNGTRVNGQLLQGAWELVDGDKLFLGETVLRFAMADAMDRGYHDELSQRVRIDPLTGLDAQHCFDDALNIALGQAQRQKAPLSVLMMDMDGIKPINDTYGHLFGAFAISEAGKLIGRILLHRGRACRFGGDEFTAMLPGCDKTAAVAMGEEIRRQLEQAGLEKDGIRLQPTISIGVASYPDDGVTLLTLIDAADRALYRAKHAGKNRVCV